MIASCLKWGSSSETNEEHFFVASPKQILYNHKVITETILYTMFPASIDTKKSYY